MAPSSCSPAAGSKSAALNLPVPWDNTVQPAQESAAHNFKKAEKRLGHFDAHVQQIAMSIAIC